MQQYTMSQETHPLSSAYDYRARSPRRQTSAKVSPDFPAYRWRYQSNLLTRNNPECIDFASTWISYEIISPEFSFLFAYFVP